jgi:hypothetical protein
MRITRCLSLLVTVGAVLAGCGGVPSESTKSAAENGVPAAVHSSPRNAVAAYITGMEKQRGEVVCSVVDGNLRRTMVQSAVSNRVVAASAPCAEALTKLAAAIAPPGQRSGVLPTMHVAINGNTAVVTYVGSTTHKQHTFELVKGAPGWTITKINGND